MALTPWRWLAALVAACLVCSIGILNVEPSPRGGMYQSDPLEEARGSYNQEARNLAQHLRVVQVMDSLRVGSGHGVIAPIRIMLGSNLPAETRAPIEALGARATREVRDSGRMGVDIDVLYDSGSVRGITPISYYGTLDYVLPKMASDRCTVIFRFGKSQMLRIWIAQTVTSEQASQQLLGACAFYRAFGMPGPRIDNWLRTRGWILASDGSWVRAEPLVEKSHAVWYSRLFALAPSMPFETPLLQMSVAAAHCVMKEPDTCAPVVFGGRSRLNFWNENVLHAPHLLGRSDYYWPGPLGVRETYLLRDMVRTLGRDRFEQFWTSADSPEIAFTRAAGQSVDAWTAKWALDQYGPPPANGPAITLWAACMGIGLAVIAMVLGLRVAAARQYT